MQFKYLYKDTFSANRLLEFKMKTTRYYSLLSDLACIESVGVCQTYVGRLNQSLLQISASPTPKAEVDHSGSFPSCFHRGK